MGNGLLKTRVPPQAGPEDEAKDTPGHDMGEASDEGQDQSEDAQDGGSDEAEEGEAPAGGKAGRKATADEQSQLETFVAVGLKLIYEKTGSTVNDIVKTLSGGGHWAHGLAAATAMVVSKVYMSAPTPPPTSVVVQAGKELMTDLVGLAGPQHLKIHTYTPQEIQQAAVQAAKLVMTILKQAGKLPSGGPGQTGAAEPAAAPGGEPEGAPAGDEGPGAAADPEDEDQGPNAPPFPKDLPQGPNRR